LECGWPSPWGCFGPHRDVKPCLHVPVLMRSLVGWHEDEVDRLTGRPVCTLQAHEAYHNSSVCSTRRLGAPLGFAWSCGTWVARRWACCKTCWIGGPARKRARRVSSVMASASSPMILTASPKAVRACTGRPSASYTL